MCVGVCALPEHLSNTSLTLSIHTDVVMVLEVLQPPQKFCVHMMNGACVLYPNIYQTHLYIVDTHRRGDGVEVLQPPQKFCVHMMNGACVLYPNIYQTHLHIVDTHRRGDSGESAAPPQKFCVHMMKGACVLYEHLSNTSLTLSIHTDVVIVVMVVKVLQPPRNFVST